MKANLSRELLPSPAVEEVPHRPHDSPTPADGVTPPRGFVRPLDLPVLEREPQRPPPKVKRPVELSAAWLRTLQTHNARIGTRLQELTMKLVFNVLIGPLAKLLLFVFFDARLVNAGNLRVAGKGGVIWALRHYYEWDPFIPWTIALFPRALVRPALVSYSCAGTFWVRTRLARAFSFALGVLGLQKGLGAQQSAIDRVREVHARDPQACFAIYPTGPIGRKAKYEVGTGVAHLSLRCPELPLIPVSVLGVPQVRLRDVLLFKRPKITVVIGTPVVPVELPTASYAARVVSLCDRIGAAWMEQERACLARHPRGSGSVPVDEEPTVTHY